LEELREIKLPEDLELLKRFLMSDAIGFVSLILRLREKHFPQAYARISEGSIKTLVTIEQKPSENSFSVEIWPGDVRFIEPILEKWGPLKCGLSFGVKHLHRVLIIYRPIRVFDEVFMMFVDKEHFIFKPKHRAKKLKGDELPEPWSTEARKNYEGIAYGIRVNGKILSVGSVENLLEGIGSCGAAIITDPEQRNKGYATSTLAYAVRDALDIVPIVTYYVESNNMPVIRVLEKLGFLFYSAVLCTLEAEKRKN